MVIIISILWSSKLNLIKMKKTCSKTLPTNVSLSPKLCSYILILSPRQAICPWIMWRILEEKTRLYVHACAHTHKQTHTSCSLALLPIMQGISACRADWRVSLLCLGHQSSPTHCSSLMPHMVMGSINEQFCWSQFSISRKELCLYPNHLRTTLQKRGQDSSVKAGHEGCLFGQDGRHVSRSIFLSCEGLIWCVRETSLRGQSPLSVMASLYLLDI